MHQKETCTKPKYRAMVYVAWKVEKKRQDGQLKELLDAVNG